MNTKEISARLDICLPRLAGRLLPSARLSDLALDSLDTVELLCVIHEEFGVRLTEDEFHPEQTVAGLLATIANGCALADPADRFANASGSCSIHTE